MVGRALLALLFFVVGCGGYQPPAQGACAEGTLLDDEPCPADGFVAADRCFSALEPACDCLACPQERCQAAETGPTQVSCAAD